jgi:hypothetical protein
VTDVRNTGEKLDVLPGLENKCSHEGDSRLSEEMKEAQIV